ncbi:MAG: tyramine oxidase subunit B [Treponema sp.]|nr:tyramine oxidase subunit B [Spirochaetia bacterium]MDD7459488.1 tyramine oxidase subunit B [Spirochaetales bacterium]MDY5812802.1 tyramine oxidase subunit B [Treponema sp.]MEE1182743.1 tyramine oxidase subunit B [Treponema sp.]
MNENRFPNIDILFLSEKNLIECGVQDMKRCIDVMEKHFSLIGKGDYRMGGANGNEHGLKMSFPDTSDIPGFPTNGPDYRFMAMPAYLGGSFHTCGIKTYGSNQANRTKGLPRSVLMLQLLDSETGSPYAYMSANLISSMRTGAVPGLGIRHLSVEKPEIASIIGPGVMGRTAALAIACEKPGVNTIKIKGRSQKGIDEFIDFCREYCPTFKNFVVCNTIEEAAKDSDIIYFGTTNAAKFEDNPYLDDSWIKKGALVISTSALLMDHKGWSDTKKYKLVSDDYKMYVGWGKGKEAPTQKTVSTLIGMGFYDAVVEGIVCEDDITEIGDVVNGIKKGRDNDSQIIVYAVGGMPTEDVAWGRCCYEKAIEKNVGTKLNLWENPEWK